MSDKNAEQIDLSTINPAELIQKAEAQAKLLKRVKTHQLRNIFGAVSKMRTKYQNKQTEESLKSEQDQAKIQAAAFQAIEMDLVMLKPKMAYAAGRQKELKANLFNFMVNAIDSVLNAPANKKTAAVSNFFALMESLIAYHKFYGG